MNADSWILGILIMLLWAVTVMGILLTWTKP